MNNDNQKNESENAEVKRREALARAAFQDPNLDQKENHHGLSYYIDHCLRDVEDEAEFWINLIGKAIPEPADIIDQLVLKSVWSTDENDKKMNRFDFWIADYTDYVVCVSFNDAGEIESIDMES